MCTLMLKVWYQGCSRGRVANGVGNLRQPSPFPPRSLEQISSNTDMSVSEKNKFLTFIKSMVHLNPEERLDARQLLDSEWLN